jgi:hypothetical protein
MGKRTKSFKEYIDENDGIRHKKIKKESRHNFKEHLKHMIEDEDWDSLEDEINEQEHSHNRW